MISKAAKTASASPLTSTKLLARVEAQAHNAVPSRCIGLLRHAYHERAHDGGAKVIRAKFRDDGAMKQHEQSIADLEQLIKILRDQKHRRTTLPHIAQQRPHHHRAAG